jgi:hypothetical protein
MEADFDWICGIVLLILETLLQVRDAEDSLERSVHPAGSALVAKAERLHC